MDLAEMALTEGGTPAPVRFLGPWEAILLVHARRSGVLPEENRPLVFSIGNPQTIGTFLVDGRVAGSCRLEDGQVKLQRLPRFLVDSKANWRRNGRR